MNIEQIYTEGVLLMQHIYFILKTRRSCHFDPLREVQPYIDRAAKDNE